MYDRNTLNCNFLKRVVDIMITIFAITIAQFITNRFLNGSFLWTLIIIVAVVLILSPFVIYIDGKIEKYYENK